MHSIIGIFGWSKDHSRLIYKVIKQAGVVCILNNDAVHTSYIKLSSKQWSIHYISLSAMFSVLHSNAKLIKNCSKSTSVIFVATMKKMDNFHLEKKPSHAS